MITGSSSGVSSRNIPHEYPLHWRNRLRVPIGSALLHHYSAWAVVIHPVDAKRCVELRAEGGSEKPIAEEPSRSIENEDHELRFRNGKAVRTTVLREVAHDSVDVFDIVDDSAVRMTEAVVDRRAVVVYLRVCNDLRRIAYVLAIEFTQRLDCVLLLDRVG